ncbi:MAG: peptidase T, partial [Chelatococcus sp.]|nr:peptidase T [Chelatococcus sp.]
DQEARLTVLLRDFDEDGLMKRKQKLEEAVSLTAAQYPSAKASCAITDTYSNIAQSIKADGRPVELIYAALETLNIAPKIVPMRGGTDGSALSAKGIPTPNFFTGAHNFHSRFEFLPLYAFEKSYQTARLLCIS